MWTVPSPHDPAGILANLIQATWLCVKERDTVTGLRGCCGVLARGPFIRTRSLHPACVQQGVCAPGPGGLPGQVWGALAMSF